MVNIVLSTEQIICMGYPGMLKVIFREAKNMFVRTASDRNQLQRTLPEIILSCPIKLKCSGDMLVYHFK